MSGKIACQKQDVMHIDSGIKKAGVRGTPQAADKPLVLLGNNKKAINL